MSKIISVQDIRESLATIANQAQAGETFVVVRNSRPVFRILPPDVADTDKTGKGLSLTEITARFDAAGSSGDLSAGDLDRIIHESHTEYGRR